MAWRIKDFLNREEIELGFMNTNNIEKNLSFEEAYKRLEEISNLLIVELDMRN